MCPESALGVGLLLEVDDSRLDLAGVSLSLNCDFPESALGVRLLSEVDDSRLDLAHGHDRVPHPLRPDPRVLDALRFRFGVSGLGFRVLGLWLRGVPRPEENASP